MRNLRQLRYYIKTSTDEQVDLRYNWIFCIINEPREIGRLTQRILKTLAPASEFQELAQGQIKNSGGLEYQSFSIRSNKGQMTFDEKQQIYNVDKRQFGQDRQLDSVGQPPEVWFADVYIPRVLR